MCIILLYALNILRKDMYIIQCVIYSSMTNKLYKIENIYIFTVTW